MSNRHRLDDRIAFALVAVLMVASGSAMAEGESVDLRFPAPAEAVASEPEAAPADVEPPLAAAVKPTAANGPGRRIGDDRVRAAALRPLIAQQASDLGVPFGIADAVVRIESRYNVGARNGPHMGLTQINYRTAQSLGYAGTPAGLLDPETNLRFGLKYLAAAYRLAGGDTCGTILRYQAGHRAVSMTRAAQAYCSKVKTIIAVAE